MNSCIVEYMKFYSEPGTVDVEDVRVWGARYEDGPPPQGATLASPRTQPCRPFSVVFEVTDSTVLCKRCLHFRAEAMKDALRKLGQ